MNKELEDFKENITKELKQALASMTDDNYLRFPPPHAAIARLISDLKPEPEFILGEIVRTHFNGVDVLCELNKEFDNSTAPYPTKDGCYYKIEALPMHMTVYDGTNIPKDDELVIVKYVTGQYSCGSAIDLTWDEDITEFQILKDLNP